MAKPTNDATGRIKIPEQDVQLWIQTNYLKPAAGTFVTWGKLKLKDGYLEAEYATSTDNPPATPEPLPV